MTTIVEGKAEVTKILGKQRLKDTTYRLMKYTLCTSCEDGILLHNAITGQMVLLNSEESSILNRLPVVYTESLASLIEDGFLVPVSYDEKFMVDNLRNLLKRLFTPEGINSYTILTTTNCNARCFYCYQANYPHINMTEEMAGNLLDFMISHKSNDLLHIQWFGGEPLVGIARIDQISKGLIERKIEFTSSMISNGYLFSKDIVERAIGIWKLKNIQITLDGTEEIYNKTKAYVGVAENPFKRVLKNINLLLDNNVRVGIRLNLDQHNFEDLLRLVTEISELIRRKELLNVYAHVVYENEGYAPIKRDRKESDELYSQQLQINKMIVESGLSRMHLVLPALRYRSCMADNPRSMVVYPDGRLFKCEHTIVGEEFGHIDSSEIDKLKIAKYSVPSDMKKCNSCPLYPSCYILKECDGLKDRKPSVCRFDVDMTSMAMLHYYSKKQKKGEKLEPDHLWREKDEKQEIC